jgi:hypothetical protein
MVSSNLAETIILHLGGEAVLTRIGAHEFFSDGARVTFRLSHPNPKGVRSVVISIQPNDRFAMQCYGEPAPGTLTTPLVGSAAEVIPENLATVLGRLAGIESIHHRHY